mgnify:CR=1 FL=1
MAKSTVMDEGKQHLTIAPPNIQRATFAIVGTSPYVQQAFSEEARQQMHADQEAGSTTKKGRKRAPKDFQKQYENAMHIAMDGWHGIPAPAFRNAMVSACRLCGFHMTKAKLAVWTVGDGIDRADKTTPLVRITNGKPEYSELPVRNANGSCDLRARPMWPAGWEAEVTVEYDADMFTIDDVANLLLRVGLQVGIGAGRNDSTSSCGMGWGHFKFKED